MGRPEVYPWESNRKSYGVTEVSALGAGESGVAVALAAGALVGAEGASGAGLTGAGALVDAAGWEAGADAVVALASAAPFIEA